MTRIAPPLFSFLVLFALDASVAHACSDAGAPNRSCSDDPDQPWLECDSHADCPSEQVCNADGHCACECPYGEMCEGDACRCADRPDPVVPPGCGRVIDSCGDVQVRCPPPDAGPAEEGDPCRPDGGFGSTVPEECREPKTDEGGACSAGGGSATSGVLALLGAWLVRRRPRARR
jgi:uncharacterized protein (TIGR03382 family)